jgi:hypothetical protein
MQLVLVNSSRVPHLRDVLTTFKHAVYKPMEVIVKARLLLTSALLMFVQIPASQAQVTVEQLQA